MEHPIPPSAPPPVLRFNLNDTVRVKLTDHGRAVLRKQRLALAERLPEECHARLLEFKEDADGWSEWQAWALMHEFGRHMIMGRPETMMMTIEIPMTEAEIPASMPSPNLQTAAANFRAALSVYSAAAKVEEEAFESKSPRWELLANDLRLLQAKLDEARSALESAAIEPSEHNAEVDELRRLLAATNQHCEDLIRINGEWTAWGAEVLGTHTSDDGYRQAILHMLGAKVGPRQSITKFLWSEAKRIDETVEAMEALGNPAGAERCRIKAGHTRTLAMQVERGRDMDGKGPQADKPSTIAELLAAAVTFRDAEAAWHAATPDGGEWAPSHVVGAASIKQRVALEALCVAAVRTANAMTGDSSGHRVGASREEEVDGLLGKALAFIERHDGWILHPGQDLHGYIKLACDALRGGQ